MLRFASLAGILALSGCSLFEQKCSSKSEAEILRPAVLLNILKKVKFRGEGFSSLEDIQKNIENGCCKIYFLRRPGGLYEGDADFVVNLISKNKYENSKELHYSIDEIEATFCYDVIFGHTNNLISSESISYQEYLNERRNRRMGQ